MTNFFLVLSWFQIIVNVCCRKWMKSVIYSWILHIKQQQKSNHEETEHIGCICIFQRGLRVLLKAISHFHYLLHPLIKFPCFVKKICNFVFMNSKKYLLECWVRPNLTHHKFPESSFLRVATFLLLEFFFLLELPECEVYVNNRKKCHGETKKLCEAAGCCYDDTTPGTYCYHKDKGQSIPQHSSLSLMKIDIFLDFELLLMLSQGEAQIAIMFLTNPAT